MFWNYFSLETVPQYVFSGLGVESRWGCGSTDLKLVHCKYILTLFWARLLILGCLVNTFVQIHQSNSIIFTKIVRWAKWTNRGVYAVHLLRIPSPFREQSWLSISEISVVRQEWSDSYWLSSLRNVILCMYQSVYISLQFMIFPFFRPFFSQEFQ